MKQILLGIAALLVTGCCSCRKTIVFVEVPYTTSCRRLLVDRDVLPSAPQFIPRSRRDSLLETVSREADRIARETMIDLIPHIR